MQTSVYPNVEYVKVYWDYIHMIRVAICIYIYINGFSKKRKLPYYTRSITTSLGFVNSVHKFHAKT